MTDDERSQLALGAAELLRPRATRHERRIALETVVDFFGSSLNREGGCQTIRSVMDAEYVFRDPEARL